MLPPVVIPPAKKPSLNASHPWSIKLEIPPAFVRSGASLKYSSLKLSFFNISFTANFSTPSNICSLNSTIASEELPPTTLIKPLAIDAPILFRIAEFNSTNPAFLGKLLNAVVMTELANLLNSGFLPAPAATLNPNFSI